MTRSEASAPHVLQVPQGDNRPAAGLAHTLHGVTLAEATRPPTSPNTIALLLYHRAFWNYVMTRRAQGLPTAIGPANGFGGPAWQPAAGWLALQAATQQSAQELAATIGRVPEAKITRLTLPGYPPAHQGLHGAAEHTHYQVGQPVLLKNLVRSSKADA